MATKHAAVLQVSNRTVNFDGRIYNLRQVSSVSKGHGRIRRPFKAGVLGYSFLAVVASLFVASVNDLRGVGILATVLSVGFLAFVVYRNTRPRDFWVLQLEVAGHYSRLIASRDESAINQAISQVCAALETDAPFQSTVNISGSTIISDSELEGVTITNTSGR